MSSLNKCMIIGRLGKDPEMRYTPNGVAVCNFTVATDDSVKDRDGNRESRVDWHKIVCFNKTAELCGEHLVKGRMVYLEGKLQHRQYDDRDGNKRSITEILANTVQFLDSKGKGGATDPAAQQAASSFRTPQQVHQEMGYGDVGSASDDIPF